MSKYLFNGKPWAGSFILEASTDGNSWNTMIAKSGNNFLGREGLVANGATNVSSGYNNDGFSNTQFSIYLPVGSYSEPKELYNLTINGELSRGSTASCTVTIRQGFGSTWVAGSNAMGDFSVHCILASKSEPYWTPGTTFNCVVTGYDNTNGNLSFNATPNINGDCRFIVLVRSGLGTGELIRILRTNVNSTVTLGVYALLLDASDSESYQGSGSTWKDISGNGRDGTLMNRSGDVTPTNRPTYRDCPTGLNGKCFSFDAVDDVVLGDMPTIPGTNTKVCASAHTITCWFYRTGYGPYWCNLYSHNYKQDNSHLGFGASHLGFLGSPDNFGVNKVGDTDPKYFVSVDLGTHLNRWICATVVYEGTTTGSNVKVYVYKDGILLQGSGTLTWNLNTGPTKYIVGADVENHSAPARFQGHIAYVAVYPRVLTAREIDDNYNFILSRQV
jgi:hypothetical protein